MMQPEALLEPYFSALPMAIAVFDRQTRLVRCNATWQQYVQKVVGRPAAPGEPLFALLPGAEPTLRPFVERALAGETVRDEALRLVGQEMVVFWNTTFMPVGEPAAPEGFLHVASEVTERVLSRHILEQRVRDRTRKLSALYDVLSIAAEPRDIGDVLAQTLAQALAAVGATGGALHLLDASGDRLMLVASQGLSDSVLERLRTMAADPELADWQAASEDALPLSLPGADWRADGIVRQGVTRVYVGVPMNVRGRVIGLLSALRETKRPFSQEDISLLDAVADQIGTVVESARLRRENEKLLVVRERNRLARELHDAVTQTLYSLTLFAETARRNVAAGDLDAVAGTVQQLVETAHQALKEMRLLVHNLRPIILEKAGLVPALQQRLDGVEKRAGVQTTLRVEGTLALAPRVEEALYHIAQEALNNALKHAAASAIWVELLQDAEKVCLTVHDNGIGFDPAAMSDQGGLGLTSMRERAESLGGALTLRAAPDAGTAVSVTLILSRIPASTPSPDLFAESGI